VAQRFTAAIKVLVFRAALAPEETALHSLTIYEMASTVETGLAPSQAVETHWY
jgi:hypothetical protein